MKLLILLLLPVWGISQAKFDTIKILNKVEILSPKELSVMSDEMFAAKYQQPKRPTLVLSDEDGTVNLIADMTKQPATEDQLASYKDFRIATLKKNRADAELLEQGVKTINGKKVGYFKFLSQAVDQKVFNYYFFTVVDGKILLFTFNCTEKLKTAWEKTANEIVASLKVK